MRSTTKHSGARALLAVASLLLSPLAGCALNPRDAAASEIAMQRLDLVDTSRRTQTAFKFPGAPSRRLETLVWYPAKHNAGPYPLIVFSHGAFGTPDNAQHIAEDLVSRGYIVAAPSFPLTSRTSHAQLPGAFLPDVRNQPADVSFVIDQLLASKAFGPLIDAGAIGSTGHSLGGVTSYFLSYAARTRDPRIAANAVIAGGDPVSANTAFQLGFDDAGVAAVQTPVLFLSADTDLIANMSGAQFTAYSRLSAPKYELSIRNGVHTFFVGGDDSPPRADGKSPDCTPLEASMPGAPIPGCEGPREIIAVERQQAITRDALGTFFDAYLKHDAGALARLRKLAGTHPETELRAVE